MASHRLPSAWTRLSLLASFVTALSCTPTAEYADPPAQSYTVANFTLDSATAKQPVTGASISGDFFQSANVRPLLGRLFVAEEYRSNALSPVAVLSHDLWTSAFKTAPEIIGSKIRVDGRDVTVVGIAPKGFTKPAGAKLWIPKP